MAKKPARIEEPVLAEGVLLSRGFYEREEKRVLTLFLKGLIVYLYTMGGIGFYLSAFNILYNKALVHTVVFVMAIFCALLYYRLLTENLGYLILLAGFAGLVYVFRKYINSGFYAVVNITVEDAAQYFGNDMKRLYNEQIGDRYVTVTMAALFIGIVLDILLNVYISRRMQYMNALITILPINLIPLYMTEEPDTLYVIMIVVATALAIVYKSSRHYSPLMQVKRTDAVFVKKKKTRGRTELSYVYDVKGLAQAGIIAGAFSIVVVLAVTVLKPVENFNVGYKINKYKEVSMAAVGTFLVDGFEGFFRRGNMRGGLRTGRLGDVSSIRLDHQPDVMIEYTPYSSSMLYLKGFTGDTYIPYENYWGTNEKLNDRSVHPEADALAEAFEEEKDYSARGVMRIYNADGDKTLRYVPYYYAGDEEKLTNYDEVIYYPLDDRSDLVVPESAYPEGKPYTEDDLFVPEENRKVIRQFCEDLSLDGMDGREAVQTIADYFQDEIPYTVKPGKTPKDEDFVNYFLEENRKGYCVHFATSAVLALRYVGIPARYCEGYAVDINQVMDGEMLENRAYSDYFSGYNSLGETAMVHVNATDADAHAWIEYYVEGKGWRMADVTPSSSEEEDVTDFWDEFDRIMGDGDEDNTEDGTGVGAGIPAKAVRGVIYVIFGLLGGAVCVVILIWAGKYVVYLVRFAKADWSDKLIMRYHVLYKRRSRRDKELRECLNYRTQVTYLAKKRGDAPEAYEWLIEALEQAGFSKVAIDENTYLKVSETCKDLYKRRKER